MSELQTAASKDIRYISALNMELLVNICIAYTTIS